MTSSPKPSGSADSAGSQSAADTLPTPLIALLATSAGLAVASIYYNQPMLGIVGADLQASAASVGLVPTLTQLGYALGILLLAPLGDRYDRRKIITGKALGLVVALLLAAGSPSIHMLLLASLAIGVAATMAQDIVPAAAVLAPAAHRGKVVGSVMTGLLLGILLSRVISGVVADQFGWRAMFIAAAASMAIVAMASWRGLPRFKATTHLGYRALMFSLVKLWRAHGALRRAALAQGLLAAGFSAFWSTLAVLLHAEPFNLGSAAAGAFGIAGAAGALAAPLAGRMADRSGPERVTRLGAGLVLLAFVALTCLPLLPPKAGLWLLAIGAVGFDLGFQATLIAHQTIIYGLDPGARSRLNALLFVGVFTGMAVGAAFGGMLLAQFGWLAVSLFAAVAALAALVLRLWSATPPTVARAG